MICPNHSYRPTQKKDGTFRRPPARKIPCIWCEVSFEIAALEAQIKGARNAASAAYGAADAALYVANYGNRR